MRETRAIVGLALLLAIGLPSALGQEHKRGLAKELGWEKITVLSVTDAPPGTVRDVNELAQRTPAGEMPVSARVTIKCSR